MCSDSWKPVLGQSVFFIGSVIGGIILGVLADNIGRLHVLVIANMLAFFGNATTAFSYDAIIFGASRFLAGCATDANFVMMYIIGKSNIFSSMFSRVFVSTLLIYPKASSTDKLSKM